MVISRFMKFIGVIPARMASKRLPGKALRRIQGKALVHHVYDRAREAQELDDLMVATDSDEIYSYCVDHGIKVVMTSPQHPSGTDRIYEVMQKVEGDVFVNIQGDEPLVRREHIRRLIEPFEGGSGFGVSTLKTPITSEDAKDPNNVKVVTDVNNRALYFSRWPIPYNRDRESNPTYFKHLGFYAYTREALSRFHHLPQSSLEQWEKLEQLRFLENGIPICVLETPFDTVGVDTESDLRKVEEILLRGL